MLDKIDLSLISNRIIVTGASYAVIFAFGLLLASFGSPYSTLLLTVHKLASVAAVILLYKSFVAVHQATGLTTVALALGVVTGLLFLGLVATGGLISIGGNVPEVVYTVHRVMPALNLLSAAASLYILYNLS